MQILWIVSAAAFAANAWITGGVDAAPAPAPLGEIVAQDPASPNTTDPNAPALKLPSGVFQDDCGRVGGRSVISYAEYAHRCFSQHVITPQYRKKHIAEMKSYWNLYPFLDLQKDSLQNGPNVYAAKIDFFSELDKLAADDSITLGFDFHSRLKRLIASMNDAHNSYEPQCYGSFLFIQPWNLIAKYSSGSATPSIEIHSTITQPDVTVLYENKLDIATYWSDFLNNKRMESYAGYKVTAIDGKDVLQFIQEVGDKTGFSREPESRFNFALSQFSYYKGGYQLNPSELAVTTFIGYGSKTYRTYDLQSPTGEKVTMSIPWLSVRSGDPFSNYVSFFAKFCTVLGSNSLGSSTTGLSLVSKSSIEDDDDIRIRRTFAGKEFFKALPSMDADFAEKQAKVIEDESKKAAAEFIVKHGLVKGVGFSKKADTLGAGSIRFTSNDKYFGFGLLSDGVTGIFSLTTFAPRIKNYSTDGSIKSGFANLATLISKGLSTLKNLGATKLIVDLSQNGGGYVCLSAALSQFFKSDTDVELFDTVFNAAGQALAKTDTFVTEFSQKSAGMKMRGGVQGEYSTPFATNCGSNYTIPGQFPFALEDVLLLSDGYCGSACAMFTNVLKDSWGVRAYVQGGTSGKPFALTSFNGGFVFDFETLSSSDPDVGLGTTTLTSAEQDLLPIPFTFPIYGQLALTEGYSIHGKRGLDVPAEFVQSPADAWVPITDASDKASIYANAMAIFNAAPRTINGNQKSESQSSLSKTMLIAIIAGVVVVVIGAVAGIAAWYKKKRNNSKMMQGVVTVSEVPKGIQYGGAGTATNLQPGVMVSSPVVVGAESNVQYVGAPNLVAQPAVSH
ncbi:hypothetical protein HDU97_006256 [Phlyctochytrium planicorne]|nr:hypothetical protein HDU97_006256 [Phlyctochytrium planicorne]